MNIARRMILVRKLRKNLYGMGREELIEHQEERTSKVLDHVKKSSPYYRDLLGEDKTIQLKDLPLMNKAVMMEDFNRINCCGLRSEDLFRFSMEREKRGTLELFRGKYSVGMSSGTSGNKGLTVLSKEEMAMYSCLLWARNGIPEHIRKKSVFFALRVNSPSFMEIKKFGLKLIYVDYTHPIGELVSLINREELNILAGPPSLLSILAEHKDMISSRIDALISYAEILYPETERRLKEIFNAPIVQIYQGSEGFIGTTCSAGKLHMNEDVIRVDLEDAGDPEGNTCKVVLTDLYRTTQPLIRYHLNDLIEVSNKKCECGSSFRVIDRIHGRSDDLFLLKADDGEIRYLFPDYVRRAIIQSSDDIQEYQAIQHGTDRIEIRLILGEDTKRPVVEGRILENLKWRVDRIGGRLGEVTFSAEPPGKNPRSGKMIRIMRERDEDH
ncbi:MAG: hypothetical protein KAH57_04480 [Thermoplasmata archaeon]|nr:hypothetical protein [Thermoplasmata archaeon]